MKSIEHKTKILLFSNVVAMIIHYLIYVFITKELNAFDWSYITKIIFLITSIIGIMTLYNSWCVEYECKKKDKK